MPESYYDTLRIAPTATRSEIRQAYRRIAAEWHPDKWRQREPALGDAMFRSLAEAFVTLSDPAARERYDEHRASEGAAGVPPPGESSVEPGRDVRFAKALSTEAADEVFMREMEAFTAELAAEGMSADDVGQYLESLGCPARIARGLALSIAGARAGRADAGVGTSDAPPSRGIAPWPVLEPLLVAWISGRAEPRRMQDIEFDRLDAGFRRQETLLLGVLAVLAAVAMLSGIVDAPPEVLIAIPVALAIVLAWWASVALAYARANPDYRAERRLRAELPDLHAIAIGRPALRAGYSLSAALAGPAWAALHGMPAVSFGWIATVAGLALGLRWSGFGMPWAFAVHGVCALAFGFLGQRMRFARALRAIADCGALGEDERLARLARSGRRRPRAALVAAIASLMVLAGILLAPEGGLSLPVTRSPESARAPASGSEARDPVEHSSPASADPIAQQRDPDAEFNRMMADFERRHPEFDAHSPKYEAAAADALRRRIEALEAQGFASPDALRQAITEYERLLGARAAAGTPTGSATPAGPAAGMPAVQDDALRTLCETFPHACRR